MRVLQEEYLSLPLFAKTNAVFSVVRLDQIHPHVSGNKWFKLQPALALAAQNPGIPLLSFGGGYSNHIHALAYAGHQLKIPTIGVIRGEQVAANLTLQEAEHWGMQLHFVSRETYRRRVCPEFLRDLQQQLGPFVLIPEGGSSLSAVQTCGHIWDYFNPLMSWPDVLFCAAGTGATAAGLIAYAPANVRIVVVPVIKISAQALQHTLQHYWSALGVNPSAHYTLLSNDKPYARITAAAAASWKSLAEKYALQLDPVYTLRAFEAMQNLASAGEFKAQQKIALLHTGGMQGLRSMESRLNDKSRTFCGPIAL